MKITLIAVGKTKERFLEEIIDDYVSRIGHFTTFTVLEVSDEKLVQTLEHFDRIFLLDEIGKEYASRQFAEHLQKQLNSGVKSVCFVIGGAYGFDEAVREMANETIALSKMTFPHQLVRVIFLEQLYRAFTILGNQKYHH